MEEVLGVFINPNSPIISAGCAREPSEVDIESLFEKE